MQGASIRIRVRVSVKVRVRVRARVKVRVRVRVRLTVRVRVRVRWLPRRVLHSTRGYCGSPGTVGTADGYCRVLWVLQGTVGTVGTARAKVTVGYCGSTRGYCRVLWVLWVLQGTGYCGYCRCVLQGTAGYCRVYRKLELRVLYATLTGIETGYEIS